MYLFQMMAKRYAFVFFSEFRDQVWCQIKLNNQDKLLVGCIYAYIYRSPDGSRLDFTNMVNLLKQVVDLKPSHLLIMDNFNRKETEWAQGETSVGEEHLATLFRSN